MASSVVDFRGRGGGDELAARHRSASPPAAPAGASLPYAPTSHKWPFRTARTPHRLDRSGVRKS